MLEAWMIEPAALFAAAVGFVMVKKHISKNKKQETEELEDDFGIVDTKDYVYTEVPVRTNIPPEIKAIVKTFAKHGRWSVVSEYELDGEEHVFLDKITKMRFRISVSAFDSFKSDLFTPEEAEFILSVYRVTEGKLEKLELAKKRNELKHIYKDDFNA